MADKIGMEKFLKEIEELYELHAKGVNEEKCREFGKRMAISVRA